MTVLELLALLMREVMEGRGLYQVKIFPDHEDCWHKVINVATPSDQSKYYEYIELGVKSE